MLKPTSPAARDAFIAPVAAVQAGAGLRTSITSNRVLITVESALFGIISNGTRAPGLPTEDVRNLTGDMTLLPIYDALARKLTTSMAIIEVRRLDEADHKLQANAEAQVEQRRAEAERNLAEQGLPLAQIGRPKRVAKSRKNSAMDHSAETTRQAA